MLKKIWISFLLFFILFIALFCTLSSGVKIDSFSFAGVNISQLYIKLDKKLIVHIERVEIPQYSKPKTIEKNSNLYIDNITWLLKIFESVDIELLKIKDNQFSITINKSIFYLDNNQINFSATPIFEKNRVIFDIHSLLAKKHNILFMGELSLDLQSHNMKFNGRGLYKDLEFALKTKTDDEIIDFDLSIKQRLQDIKYVKDFARLHPIIEEWMYDNVTGDIILEHLKGKLDTKTFMPIVKSINAVAKVENAQVRFHKDLDVVTTPLLKVTFKDDNLFFDLKKPKYKDISIDGSKVGIFAISNRKIPSNIIVDITTKHHLDKDILNILKAYKVDLPIGQLNGTTNSHFALQVFFASGEVKTSGVFKTENSLFSLNGFEFLAKNATVELSNAIVKIVDSDVLVDNLVDGKLNLSIDTANKNATGDANLNSLKVSAHELDLINIEDFYTTIEVDYTQTPTISFGELFADIIINKDFVTTKVHSLDFAKKYSSLLQSLNLEGGDLSVDIHSKDNIDFFANLDGIDTPLYTKDGAKLKDLHIRGNATANSVKVGSIDGNLDITINERGKTIKLTNIDVENIDTQNSTTSGSGVDFVVYGENSDIIISDSSKLKSTNYTLKLKDKKVDLESFYKGGAFYFSQDKSGKIAIQSTKLNDEFMNNLLGSKELFANGEFNLVATGPKDKLEGKLVVVDSKIKSLAILNNIIAFINVTPAVINPLFALPAAVGMAANRYDVTSYAINSSTLEFVYNLDDSKFFVEDLTLIGDVANLHAVGVVDIATNTIDSEVSVVFLKSYSTIVSYIPVVNYLLLGDDDKISTEVRVTGNLDDPQVQTNLAKDTALGTFNFFKRIFLLPKKGLDYINE